MTEKKKKSWSEKSIFSKLSDLAFIVIIVAMFFPQGRLAIGGFVNSIKAKISNPSRLSDNETVAVNNLTWKLQDTEGNAINLADMKGKVLFINMWATWCPPCVGEMPEIQKLYDIYKDNDDIAFFMVSNEKSGKIKSFVDKKGYSFPVFTSISNSPDAFASKSIPTTFVISKKGEIVVRETGAANWGGKKMQKLINELLE